eukprot:scaffold460_cov391-Pavlova_lutheri.AAC.3
MSDGEEENPLGTATRLQRLREELTREQQARATLTEQVRLLENTKENGTEDARSSEEDQPLLEEENALPPVVVQPLNEEGLQSLTKLYKSMGESQRLQGVSLARPSNFSGLEVVEDPYALTHWYREVSCWVQGYAKDPIQQVVLALQTLKGTARIMVDNIIMSDPKRRRDPGPDAWKEFQRARLRTNRENVIGFLNRLLLLSFVINMSEDPTCPTVSESDIATKLRMRLPYNISNQLEQHMQLMVDVGSVPEISPRGIAATALKVEAQEREKSRMTNRQPRPAENKVNRTLNTAVVHALPERSPTEDRPKWSTSGRAAKRFRDLPESLQKRIVELQKELQDLPLGATLTPDQQQRRASNSLCIRCRRYGHDARNCQQTKPMIPKN